MTKATKLRKEKARKKQEVVDKQKADIIAKKRRRKWGRYSLSIKNDGYNNSEISNTDPNQENGLSNLEDN